ncbi:MAG: phosphate ABC transporter, permease protein PstA, partial [Gammaproteobacteria bacterium]
MNIKHWFNSGAPFVWLNAGAVSICIIMVAGLIGLIAVRGLGHFWPADIAVFDYYETPKSEVVKMMGEVVDEETVSRSRAGNPEYEGDFIKRDLIKTGNRDVSGLDFEWILNAGIKNVTYPEEAIVVERREWGNFYGYLTDL